MDKHNMKHRETWVDVAKAIGIITVVVGHSGNAFLAHYIYWFHMPFFFILSGYTFNPPKSKKEFLPFLQKKTYSFMVPYFVFGISIILFMIFTGSSKFSFMLKQVGDLLYGGQDLKGYFGVFWFITSLFLTQIVFSVLTLCLKSKHKILLFVGVSYILSHIYSKFIVHSIPHIPWNADVVFMSIVYFAVGFYLKGNFEKNVKRKPMAVFIPLASITLVAMELFGFYSYSLNMKSKTYIHFWLDLIIPVVFSFLVFIISYGLTRIGKMKFFSEIGRISLIIMYLHLPIKVLLINSEWYVSTVAGLVFPILIHFLFRGFPAYQYLFCGKYPFNKVKY